MIEFPISTEEDRKNFALMVLDSMLRHIRLMDTEHMKEAEVEMWDAITNRAGACILDLKK